MNDLFTPKLNVDGPRATITLCRPAEHNRIDPDDIEVLQGYLESVITSPAIRVLVITGTGERTFSSGYTIQAIRDRLDDRFERLLDTLETLPLPVICALNGSVYGGAIDLALCCDFRLGVRDSRMLMPASKFGLHYYPGGIRRYVTRLGLSAAKRLFLTALPVDAEEMLRMGFLTELVDAKALDKEISRYAEAIVACVPEVVISMKGFLNQTADGNIDIGAQRAAYEKFLASTELADRIAALDKS
jgi:enoyl-CoA hydratase/carnithine racemase